MLNGKFVAWPPSIFCVAKSTLRNPFCISRLNAAPAIAAMRIVPVRNHGNAIYLQNQRRGPVKIALQAFTTAHD